MRTARARHYLMCRPTYFDVVYSINPWMDPKKPVDTPLAIAQWERLREVYLSLGHTVDTIEPVRGLPDMVFAANGATVVDGRALVARFRDAERIAEGPAYHDWLRANGFPDLRTASVVNEGEGDYLLVGDVLLAGTGFRSDPRSHDEAQEFFGRPVIGLTLVDPDYYHLDTALTVLDERTVAYYPPAFSPAASPCCNGSSRTPSSPRPRTPRCSGSTPHRTGSTWSCRRTRLLSPSSCASAVSARSAWTSPNSSRRAAA